MSRPAALPPPREAVAADAPAIARANVQAWREAYGGGLMPRAIIDALSIERSADRWSRSLGEDAGGAFVVAPRDGVIAFATCGAQRDPALVAAGYAGEIFTLYVLAAWHRRGVATALVDACARDLASRGRAGFALWTLRDNIPARSFYERCGGSVIAAREDRRDAGAFHEIAYGWPVGAYPLTRGDCICRT